MDKKHHGTEYNAYQRLQTSIIKYKESSWHYRVVRQAYGDSPVNSVKKKHLTMAKRRLEKSKQRLSLACTYWLQHNPLGE